MLPRRGVTATRRDATGGRLEHSTLISQKNLVKGLDELSATL